MGVFILFLDFSIILKTILLPYMVIKDPRYFILILHSSCIFILLKKQVRKSSADEREVKRKSIDIGPIDFDSLS